MPTGIVLGSLEMSIDDVVRPFKFSSLLENLCKDYLKNLNIKSKYDLKNININKIVYNSIYFMYWNNNSIGVPSDMDNIREFVLLTINFGKGNTENTTPGENPDTKNAGYGFQFFISLDAKIYFRVFDWATQKYLKWHQLSFYN